MSSCCTLFLNLLGRKVVYTGQLIYIPTFQQVKGGPKIPGILFCPRNENPPCIVWAREEVYYIYVQMPQIRYRHRQAGQNSNIIISFSGAVPFKHLLLVFLMLSIQSTRLPQSVNYILAQLQPPPTPTFQHILGGISYKKIKIFQIDTIRSIQGWNWPILSLIYFLQYMYIEYILAYATTA